LTNSLHVPVFSEVSIKDKLDAETQLAKYSTGGEINYIELESAVTHNYPAVERIVHYAMSINIPYLAINHPIDTCQKCGKRVGITDDKCPVCGSSDIRRLRRVTGYLTTDYRKFNKGKLVEVGDRQPHSKKTNFADLVPKK
jgi:anaerobic ribonucleoside-triphosphate reductase